MNPQVKVKRAYESQLRTGQAKTTRLALLEAAGRLFAEQGYVATSIEQIARAAGVSRATVFTSVGGKPVLLKAAYDVALIGDDDAVPLVGGAATGATAGRLGRTRREARRRPARDQALGKEHPAVRSEQQAVRTVAGSDVHMV